MEVIRVEGRARYGDQQLGYVEGYVRILEGKASVVKKRGDASMFSPLQLGPVLRNLTVGWGGLIDIVEVDMFENDEYVKSLG